MGNFNNLPSDIVVDILFRLPTESVLECKLVCKPWKNLVSNHSTFSKLHLSHLTDSGKFTFLLFDSQQYPEHPFYYLDYHDQTPIDSTVIAINLKLPFGGYYGLIDSCNGLICVTACHDMNLQGYEPAYICNPITKEYVVLPKITRVWSPKDYCVYGGFGYIRETNEYKVVRIGRSRRQLNFECVEVYQECVEVYTLGSGNGWRKVRDCEVSCSLGFIRNSRGVFANDTLHWITSKDKLVAFNLADEFFCEPPALPCLAGIFRFSEIGILGGVLWCSTYPQAGSRDIWLLNMKEQEEKQSLTWRKEFSLVNMKPLVMMKSGEVLCCSYTHLYSYDIKFSRSRELVKFCERVCPEVLVRTDVMPHLNTIISHMNTFTSLKALGEEDIKTME